MENENRQPWLLIAIAGLGLVLGVLALVVAFNAKSSSDDAAEEASVARVDARLTRLIDWLGIDEKAVSGKESTLQEETSSDERQARKEVNGLSSRVAELERQVSALETANKKSSGLPKRVTTLESQVAKIDSEIRAINQRISDINQRANSSAGGGESAP